MKRSRRPTRTATRRSLALLVLAAVLAQTPAYSQSAEDRATARMLAQQADEKVSAKDWAGAFELFAKAYALVPAPTLKLAMGRAKAQLGQLVEAQQHLLDAARSQPQPGEPSTWAKAREDAAKEAAALTPRIATLEVTVRGAPEGKPAHVTIDGEALKPELLGIPRALNPGKHEIRVEAPGFKTETRTVTLGEAEKQKLAIALQPDASAVVAPPVASTAPAASSAAPPPPPPPPPPPSSGSSTLAIVGFAAGGAFAIAGSVTGLMSKSKVDDIKKQCVGNDCPTSLSGDASNAKTLGWISTGAFGLAAIGVGVGIYGLFASGSKAETGDRSRPVRVGVGPGSVLVEGSF